MSTVYLLKNQDNTYLDKSGEWVDGAHSKSLYRTQFKDEAINQKVEFSVKKTELRITIAQAETANNGALEIRDYAPADRPMQEDSSDFDAPLNDAPLSDAPLNKDEPAHPLLDPVQAQAV